MKIKGIVPGASLAVLNADGGDELLNIPTPTRSADTAPDAGPAGPPFRRAQPG
jgi:hypothetical protein